MDGHTPEGFRRERVEVEGVELPCSALLPSDQGERDRAPLLLFLHGRGECGTDGDKPLKVGLAPAMKRQPERWPFVAIFPQKPEQDVQWEEYREGVFRLLDRAIAEYGIDTRRVHLTGLSQGGHGAWVLGAEHNDRWASVVSVCAYIRKPAAGYDLGDSADNREEAARLARGLAGLPTWIFHGEADSVVPVSHSRTMQKLLVEGSGREGAHRATFFPGVDHASWVQAYAEPELAAWLLEQRRA